jgi:hypothetical protein
MREFMKRLVIFAIALFIELLVVVPLAYLRRSYADGGWLRWLVPMAGISVLVLTAFLLSAVWGKKD